MINKKSQGLSINVIIIVAIALIVLVVLVAIFTGRLGSFVSGVDTVVTCKSSCSAFGMEFGTSDNQDACTGNDRFVPGDYRDVTSGICCCTE